MIRVLRVDGAAAPGGGDGGGAADGVDDGAAERPSGTHQRPWRYAAPAAADGAGLAAAGTAACSSPPQKQTRHGGVAYRTLSHRGSLVTRDRRYVGGGGGGGGDGTQEESRGRPSSSTSTRGATQAVEAWTTHCGDARLRDHSQQQCCCRCCCC
jgi:hypothetical protein